MHRALPLILFFALIDPRLVLAAPTFANGVTNGMMDVPDLVEASGIVASRNNPGVLLDQAVAVSYAFLDKGEIVSTRGRRADDAQRYNAHPGDISGGLPMVVLESMRELNRLYAAWGLER